LWRVVPIDTIDFIARIADICCFATLFTSWRSAGDQLELIVTRYVYSADDGPGAACNLATYRQIVR
jgi:hypothetical protein